MPYYTKGTRVVCFIISIVNNVRFFFPYNLSRVHSFFKSHADMASYHHGIVISFIKEDRINYSVKTIEKMYKNLNFD
jgi:hypothetical protein